VVEVEQQVTVQLEYQEIQVDQVVVVGVMVQNQQQVEQVILLLLILLKEIQVEQLTTLTE
tara:strand:- start:203 stop:382 length:180 start_codon:yes stop_codon:yes gene_type:complete